MRSVGVGRATFRGGMIVMLLCSWLIGVVILLQLMQARAANFTFKTGYYVGSGSAGLAITGLGFQPDFVMIKSATTAGVAVFKTSAMPANTVAYTSATANDTGTNITFDSDGFSVGTLANVNTSNVIYHYVAVDGSDCSATGNFCVGTYTGNGVSPRNITVGFQPALAIVKRSTAVDGHFRVASEPANETLFFTTTARDTAGNYIRSFAATTFQVGATDNANTGTYYYVTFAATAGMMAQGTFTGNGADNRNITGVGFQPDFVVVKNATSATAGNRSPAFLTREHSGDHAGSLGATTANTANIIQQLQSDGFQVGTSARTNQNTTTLYWFALGGQTADSTSGSFSTASGSYTGNGTSQSISGLGFAPDLVLVKADTNQFAVFRTKDMNGNTSAYLASATAHFAGAITSLDSDGFTVGNATQTNTNAVTYRWVAFGNAYSPYNRDGSADFAIGAYTGNGLTAREMTLLPWQPDMVATKRNGTTAGAWATSSHTGGNASFFGAAADSTGVISAMSTGGFQVGTNNASNASGSTYNWFAFKAGSNFDSGTYTGTGASQSITSAGFRAEYVWTKRNTAVAAVQSSRAVTAGSSQYFAATANGANLITDYVKGGFRVGTGAEANANTGAFVYVAWNDTGYGSLSLDIVNGSGVSVASPSYAMPAAGYAFDCRTINGSIGSASQKIRISNITANELWTLSIAATSGPTDVWRNTGDTERYDINDTTSSGCSDGGDTDSYGGQLALDGSSATITPESGCNTTGINTSATTGFEEGVVDSITLATTDNTADNDCIWDITTIDASQSVPAEQPIGDYSVNLTVTIVAN